MRSNIAKQIDKITTALLLLAVFLFPLILSSLTTEFYEIPKLAFLMVVVCVLLVLRSLSWILNGKVSFTRTPLDIPLLLILAVMIGSSLLNDQVRYIAFFGNFPRVHGSTTSFVLYILFFFLMTSHLKSKGQVKNMFYALLASATLVSAISLLSYFGVFLPTSVTQALNFNPAGSSFSAGALLIFVLPLLLVSSLAGDKIIPTPAAVILSLLFTLTLALIGDLAVIAAALVVLLLVLIKKQKQFKGRLIYVLVPVGIAVLVFFFSRASFGGTLYQKGQNFPREIELPFTTSWKISASSFRDNPFLGSGPSTYLFDFTFYKPSEFNNSNIWNVNFDSAFNEYFQTLATTGLLGILALLFFSGVVISWAFKGLNNDDNLTFSLSIAALSSVVLLVLHPSTVVSLVLTLVVLAMMLTLHKNRSENVDEIALGIKASSLTNSNLVVGDALPIILFLPILIIVLVVLWNGFRMLLADYHHRMALNSASTNGINTYNDLVASEQGNPNVDLYHTDLAQTNFALANAIASSKGPTQASPSGSLTDQDKQTIQTLLSQSINEGRAAVTLSPDNAQDWEILASIYRQISGVAQNALQFSLDSYGHAIARDPYNPLLRLDVGGVYYSVKNYNLAIRFFTDSVNLKPDYADGYYNLAVAYRDNNDFTDALSAAQPILSLVNPKSADYQTASKLIFDLKNLASKQSSGSANVAGASTSTPPAAAQSGVLQNQNLPNVLSLPQPSNIATPSAVKK